MQRSIARSLRAMRAGALLAMLGVLFGFVLGGVFGLYESGIKAALAADAERVLATAYAGDAAKAKEVTDKAWSYVKRAHLHGGGIGAAALAVILTMACAGVASTAGRLAALALGFGAMGYPAFWLLAALRAPGMGSTGAAKESLAWLAMPASAALLAGLAAAIAVTAGALFGPQRD